MRPAGHRSCRRAASARTGRQPMTEPSLPPQQGQDVQSQEEAEAVMSYKPPRAAQTPLHGDEASAAVTSSDPDDEQSEVELKAPG